MPSNLLWIVWEFMLQENVSRFTLLRMSFACNWCILLIAAYVCMCACRSVSCRVLLLHIEKSVIKLCYIHTYIHTMIV